MAAEGLSRFHRNKTEYEGAEHRIEIHDERSWRKERVWPEWSRDFVGLFSAARTSRWLLCRAFPTAIAKVFGVEAFKVGSFSLAFRSFADWP